MMNRPGDQRLTTARLAEQKHRFIVAHTLIHRLIDAARSIALGDKILIKMMAALALSPIAILLQNALNMPRPAIRIEHHRRQRLELADKRAEKLVREVRAERLGRFAKIQA